MCAHILNNYIRKKDVIKSSLLHEHPNAPGRDGAKDFCMLAAILYRECNRDFTRSVHYKGVYHVHNNRRSKHLRHAIDG